MSAFVSLFPACRDNVTRCPILFCHSYSLSSCPVFPIRMDCSLRLLSVTFCQVFSCNKRKVTNIDFIFHQIAINLPSWLGQQFKSHLQCFSLQFAIPTQKFSLLFFCMFKTSTLCYFSSYHRTTQQRLPWFPVRHSSASYSPFFIEYVVSFLTGIFGSITSDNSIIDNV